MILLGVNVDHVATLRQARYRDEPNTFGGFVEPDPAAMAWLAEDAGADGITMHVREDRRHVQVEDVQRYLERKKTRLNLEVSLSEEMVELALSLKPDSVCGSRASLGSNHGRGLDVAAISVVLRMQCLHLMKKIFRQVCLLIQTLNNWKPLQKLDRPGWNYTLEALPERGSVPEKRGHELSILHEGMEIGILLGCRLMLVTESIMKMWREPRHSTRLRSSISDIVLFAGL